VKSHGSITRGNLQRFRRPLHKTHSHRRALRTDAHRLILRINVTAFCVRTVSHGPRNPGQIPSVTGIPRCISLLREVVDGERVGASRCASARVAGINFQACTFSLSVISPREWPEGQSSTGFGGPRDAPRSPRTDPPRVRSVPRSSTRQRAASSREPAVSAEALPVGGQRGTRPRPASTRRGAAAPGRCGRPRAPRGTASRRRSARTAARRPRRARSCPRCRG